MKLKKISLGVISLAVVAILGFAASAINTAQEWARFVLAKPVIDLGEKRFQLAAEEWHASRRKALTQQATAVETSRPLSASNAFENGLTWRLNTVLPLGVVPFTAGSERAAIDGTGLRSGKEPAHGIALRAVASM